jgi:glycosyltransferase involved in cell wall biosynthesis
LIKILFIRSERAYLPEIDAYIEYFNKTDGFRAYDSLKLKGEYQLKDFDVIWEFKGFGGIKVKDQILVHEYASLSVGAFPRVKNLLKSKLNPKPHLRIFLNEDVKAGFFFRDNVRYCFRDMGIHRKFLQARNSTKEYDFVYIGSISKERKIDRLLAKFTTRNNGKLCLIGEVGDDIYKAYKNNRDIIFTGKVPYSEVPEIASKGVYGINYVPNKYPYNIQTSTKLLEYLALGLKVITTDYKWVRKFEEKYGCSFYKLDERNFDIDINEVNKYEFISKLNIEDFLWDNVIEKSGIIRELQALIR